jgi:hypothetical protein
MTNHIFIHWRSEFNPNIIIQRQIYILFGQGNLRSGMLMIVPIRAFDGDLLD